MDRSAKCANCGRWIWLDHLVVDGQIVERWTHADTEFQRCVITEAPVAKPADR